MGKIDDGGKGLAQVDAFHPAGDARQGSDACGGNFWLDPQAAHGSGESCQTVRDIVGAHQVTAYRNTEIRSDGFEAQPARLVAQGFGADIRLGAEPIADLAHAGDPAEIGIRFFVVAIEHSQPRVALRLLRGIRQQLEKPALGGQIVLVRAVLVEVLVGDVGHHGDIVLRSIHAVLGQAVRGGLEHDVRQPHFAHARQIALDVRRIGGGDVEAGVEHFVSDDCIHRRDQAGFEAGGAQDAVDQVAGGGLAVCTGHPNHGHVFARIAVVGGSQIGQGAARVFQPDVGHGQAGQFARANHGRGAAPDGRIDKVVTVHGAPLHRHEQIARLHLAAVDGDAADEQMRQGAGRVIEG